VKTRHLNTHQHRRSHEGKGDHGLPNFWHILSFCDFKRRCPKKNSVACLCVDLFSKTEESNHESVIMIINYRVIDRMPRTFQACLSQWYAVSPGPDLRQAGPRASLTIGAPATSSCSVNRGTPFLWKTPQHLLWPSRSTHPYIRMWIDFHISIQNCQRSPYDVFWLNSSLGM